VGMVVLMAAASIAAPLLLRAQQGVPTGGGAPGAAGAQPQVDDMPHYTAKKFAAFLHAIVLRSPNKAMQVFKIRRAVQNSLEQADTIRILGRFQRPEKLELNLVGGRTLGKDMGILFFTIATSDGPVSFKIYYYGFEQDLNIARIDISDDWDTIEQQSATIEILQAPITVPLGQIDEGAK
jgi:hypothetical protein